MNLNNKKIAVINLYNFPHGMAPTTRIIAYCKGLQKLGSEVDIISISPKNYADKANGEPLFGNCEGGRYYHFIFASKCKIIGVRGLLYRILHFYCMFSALRFIKKSAQKRPYDAFILSFDEPYQFNILLPELSKFKNSKIVAIADEYPTPIRHYLKDSVPDSKLEKYKKIYKNIDARILMTEKLRVFYDNKVCVKPTLLLSTIVDTDRFNNVSKIKSDCDYLCYMGNMELSKDNVDNIIEAFNLIKDVFPNLDLHLYGTPSSTDKKKLEDLISQYGLQYRVILKGRALYNDVPCILKSSKILLTSQPDTKRAEGGFPTKMGEYFMSGVPSILTNVGEISSYVENGINAFMVPPHNPKAYAEAIIYVMNNYEQALNVAARAKAQVIDNYGYLSAGKNILKFIDSI